MAKLDVFKDKIGGGIRPNQFGVKLISGGGITNIIDASGFTFLCHATSIPGSNIGQAPVFHRGRMIPLAGERTFEPWTVTVYADQQMNLRTAFEEWSNYINNYKDNSGETSPVRGSVGTGGYKADGIVSLLDRNKETNGTGIIKSWRIVGIFPIQISEMQLSWQANDMVGEFSVTFSVESFDPDEKGQDVSEIVGNGNDYQV